jgi:hypothetical protein
MKILKAIILLIHMIKWKHIFFEKKKKSFYFVNWKHQFEIYVIMIIIYLLDSALSNKSIILIIFQIKCQHERGLRIFSCLK